MVKLFYFFLILQLLFFYACSVENKANISISCVEIEIEVDGIIHDSEWESISSIEYFNSPWNRDRHDNTIFKVFANKEFFNFCFIVNDTTLIFSSTPQEIDVANGDRVELFFSPTKELEKYYCLEIGPSGRVLDYSSKYYRNFDYTWNFNSLKVTTQNTESGYIVEGQILIAELLDLGLVNPFYLGIFKADFEESEKVTWFSWCLPSSIDPDFHIPSAFGEVIIQKEPRSKWDAHF